MAQLNDGRTRDLTNFWLSWRATCSIRLCLSEKDLCHHCKDIPEVMADPVAVVADAGYVMDVTNRNMADMIELPRSVESLRAMDDASDEEAEVQPDATAAAPSLNGSVDNLGHLSDGKGDSAFSRIERNDNDEVARVRHGADTATLPNSAAKRVSEYRDYVEHWRLRDRSVISAFELLESDIYAGTKKRDENGKIKVLNGRAFKNYLFEHIGSRPGGLSRNLWGYLLKKKMTSVGGKNYPSRLRQLAKKSYGKAPVLTPVIGGETRDEDARLQRLSVQEGEDDLALSEVGRIFREYLGSGRWWREYDVNDRLAVCCAMFQLTLSDTFVLKLATLGGSALARRKDKRVGEIFQHLRDKGCEFDDVRRFLFGGICRVLLDFVLHGSGCDGNSTDLDCLELLDHFGIYIREEPEKDSGGDLNTEKSEKKD